MTEGLWFVWCKRSRAVPVEQLRGQLKVPFDGKVSVGNGALEIVIHDQMSGNDAWLSMGPALEPHIALEAQESAARVSTMTEAPSPAELKIIGEADARYEIIWDLSLSDEIYNTLALVAEQVCKLVDGVIHDPRGRRVVWSPHASFVG